MKQLTARFSYLFKSTKGLILAAIAICALISAFFGMISGPMADMGIKDVIVRVFGLKLVEAEREGRLIILYHSIAMIVVAIETYMITGLLAMKERQKVTINSTITIGYLMTAIGGLSFAYWGHNWAMHGIYIAGLVIIFFAGCMLLAALWPWREEYKVTDRQYAHTRAGFSMERIAFFAVALATLISALFGAVPGSYYGNG